MAYEKGQETEHGIYLGERMVDRPERLSRSEAEKLVPADYSGDRDNLINVLQDRMVVHVFDDNGMEVEVPA